MMKLHLRDGGRYELNLLGMISFVVLLVLGIMIVILPHIAVAAIILYIFSLIIGDASILTIGNVLLMFIVLLFLRPIRSHKKM